MSTWLRKTKNVPGSAPGGYVWNTPEDVVEVTDDWLAADLLEIPDAGFLSVPAPEAEPEKDAESEASATPAKPARKSAAKAPAKTEIQE